METIVIVIHLIIVLALVGVVLLQRSEGGALGIGGGSGFMTARGAANALTRTTAILAAAFFATSLVLGIMARYSERPIDILDRAPVAPSTQPQVPGGQAPGTGGGILNQLGGQGAPAAPSTESAPANPPAGGAVPIAPLNPVAPSTEAAPAAPAPQQPATPTVPSSQ